MTPPRLAGARSLALGALLASGCTLDAIGAFEGTGASTASGGGGSGAGTAPTSSGSGGADRTIETDCTNGLDDDVDGAVDCDDGDCGDAGFRCLDEVPGALGYAYATDDGSCSEAWALDARRDCSTGCSCGSVDGTCRIGVDSYGGSGCTYYRGYFEKLGCENIPDDYRAYKVYPVTDLASACAPTSGPTFGGAPRDLCRVEVSSVGLCGASQVCTPPHDSDAPLCALLPAASACPTSLVDLGVLGDSGAGCSCNCAKTGATCVDAHFAIYNASDLCNAAYGEVKLPADGVCRDAGWVWSLGWKSFSEQATCAANGAPLAPDTAVRLCCEPPPK